jgi:ribose transport system ATP-binding protein
MTVPRDLSQDRPGAPQTSTLAPPLVQLAGISKSFGPSRALEDVSLTLTPGEVLGLVGANGAGKSTLMRILAGVTLPDAGTLELNGQTVDFRQFSPERARALGIRFVHQELSLCESLNVAENFYIEQPHYAGSNLRWRRHYENLAATAIDEIFPDSGIDVRRPIADLVLAQRQMVEIARAASDPNAKVLILDEPTSALDARRSNELQRFIAARAARGIVIIFISHKLPEVKAVASRVLVMRNGKLALDAPAASLDVPDMIAAMAGEAVAELEQPGRRAKPGKRDCARTMIEVTFPYSSVPLSLHAGEIVGVAGLEGSGQREFLRALYKAAKGEREQGIACKALASYVSGDRSREGVFPLWDVIPNATIGRIARGFGLTWLSFKEEQAVATPFLDAVQLPPERRNTPILQLSGGNQQKVLMARALLADTEIILLDDPTRGVDVAVKREFYRLIREAAAEGKLIIWYSSETIEFLECEHVLLFSDGAVQRVLGGEELSEDAIVNATFDARLSLTSPASQRLSHAKYMRVSPEMLFRTVPFGAAALIFAMIAVLNHSAVTLFGIDLLLSAAVPLVLVALGQMFVVGGSEIDLGIGAFAGLVNVLSATFLVETPLLGFGLLVLALGAYAIMGVLIQLRAIPAIVVTLGASFIWAGLGYALQPTPGGSAPAWLADAAAFRFFGMPASVLAIIVAGGAAALLNNSRLGVVLRGFGANPRALSESGWSMLHAAALRYAIAGGFALLCGLALTAINTASDINAGSSFTLLSIAAVVVGGSALAGGHIAPIGVLCGALSLSLIGGLLGFIGVSTDYNAAVQGGLLIAILALRSALRGRAA